MRRIALLFLLLAALPMPAAARIAIGQGALGNIFVEGEPIAVPVYAPDQSLRWQVHDFFGNQVASGELHPSGGTAAFHPAIAGPGYFILSVTAARTGGTAEAAFAVVPRPKPAAADSPFGVMTHFAKGWPIDIIPLIDRAGIGHIRDEQPWGQVETARGRYLFPPRLDAYMTALAARHIDPLIVLAFANRLYDDGKTPYTDAGRAAYAAYARAVAQHFGHALKAVEVWNEYNGSFCDGPCRSDRPKFYAAMLQDTYRTLKSADPSLTVLGGAAVPIPLDYFQKLFQKGALDSMDAVVIHPYRSPPEGVERDIAALRRLMATYGKPKPIWATEFSDLADMKKSRDDVARYLVRMSTLLLSAKVARIYWYLLRDYQEFAGLGLLRDEHDPLGRYAPNPAYVAYAVLIHELQGAHFVRREASDPRVHVYAFAGREDEIRVAWSLLPKAGFDLASGGPLRIDSMMGGERRVTPQNGRVAIALSENPVYIRGGAAPPSPEAGGAARPVASSADDFSLVQGSKDWSYGMILRPGTPVAVGSEFAEPFVPLQADQGQDSWTSPQSPTLKIRAGMVHPDRSRDGFVWAVRRWSSPAAGTFKVSGTVQVNDQRAEGISFAIMVDRRVAYAAELGGPGKSRKADFTLPVRLQRGGTIDFAIGPGRGGGINFDATAFNAFIAGAAETTVRP
ncbi:MAG TPA: glycosyl hydrolase [Candidatus Sulfotelmatobacter sp.]|nr:glycosyl hydrolase [Candidatus Sulfotelmatobacter sp.]